MKSITKLLAALLAMAFIGDAVAQSTPVVVRLTGSTAYRAQINAAIAHLFGAGGTGSSVSGSLTGGATYAYAGSNYTGSSYSIVKGNLNGTDVIIKCAWSGSTGGIQTVSRSVAIAFPKDDVVTGAGTFPTGTTIPSSTVNGAIVLNDPVSEVPDISIADTFQSATPFNETLLQESINSPIGIIPFVWVAGKGAPASLTNITPQLAQSLFKVGELPLALFTGNPADESVKIFATGRDPDSGTRLTAFAESGVGTNTVVTQYRPIPIPSNTSTPITGKEIWPITTVNGIEFDLGNGGFSSGGSLVNTLGNDTSALGGYFVSYVSVGDSNNAVAAGAKRLSYNGVTLNTTTFDEIKNGSYSFWSYAHVLYRSNTPTTAKSVADAIAQRVRDVDASVFVSSMRVDRQVDGGPITPKY